MKPEQIAELEALAEKATPGPWGVYAQTIAASTPERRAANAKAEMSLQVELTAEMVEHIYLLAAGDKCPAITGCGPTSEANAALIVTLVNNLPAILAALKAQQPDAQAEPVAWLYNGPSEKQQLFYGSGMLDGFPGWTETPLYAHPPKDQQPGEDVVEWAFINIVDAVREYLSPDGLTKDQFISRVIAQTDNTTINPVIREIERRAAIAAMQESRDADQV